MAKGGGNVDVKIDIDIKPVVRYLDGVFHRINHQKPSFVYARERLELANARNFSTNGLPVGGWAPLDPEYAAWKSVNFPGAGTMVQNGKLMKSLMNLNDRSANSISDMNAEFGTSVEYAKFHQYGTSKMPKRQVVYVPVEFSHDLASKMAKYIVQQGYDFR
jgi:phage gpG-like protein